MFAAIFGRSTSEGSAGGGGGGGTPPRAADVSRYEIVPKNCINISAAGDVRGGGTGKEYVENLLDYEGRDNWNKWLHHGNSTLATSWVKLRFANSQGEAIVYNIVAYGLVSANDCPNRDPVEWDLNGETEEDGHIVRLHRVTQSDYKVFSARKQEHVFVLDEPVHVTSVTLAIKKLRQAGDGVQLCGIRLYYTKTTPSSASAVSAAAAAATSAASTASAAFAFAAASSRAAHEASAAAVGSSSSLSLALPTQKEGGSEGGGDGGGKVGGGKVGGGPLLSGLEVGLTEVEGSPFECPLCFERFGQGMT